MKIIIVIEDIEPTDSNGNSNIDINIMKTARNGEPADATTPAVALQYYL